MKRSASEPGLSEARDAGTLKMAWIEFPLYVRKRERLSYRPNTCLFVCFCFVFPPKNFRSFSETTESTLGSALQEMVFRPLPANTRSVWNSPCKICTRPLFLKACRRHTSQERNDKTWLRSAEELEFLDRETSDLLSNFTVTSPL